MFQYVGKYINKLWVNVSGLFCSRRKINKDRCHVFRQTSEQQSPPSIAYITRSAVKKLEMGKLLQGVNVDFIEIDDLPTLESICTRFG